MFLHRLYIATSNCVKKQKKTVPPHALRSSVGSRPAPGPVSAIWVSFRGTDDPNCHAASASASHFASHFKIPISVPFRTVRDPAQMGTAGESHLSLISIFLCSCSPCMFMFYAGRLVRVRVRPDSISSFLSECRKYRHCSRRVKQWACRPPRARRRRCGRWRRWRSPRIERGITF